jgi:hypothetical protein
VYHAIGHVLASRFNVVLEQPKGQEDGTDPPSSWKGICFVQTLKNVRFELNIVGIVLLSAVCCAVPVILPSLFLMNENLSKVKNQIKGRVIGRTVEDDMEVEVARAEDGADEKGLGRRLQGR